MRMKLTARPRWRSASMLSAMIALVSMCMNSKVVIPIHPTKDSDQHEHRKKIYRYNVVRVIEANTLKYDHVLLVANVEC